MLSWRTLAISITRVFVSVNHQSAAPLLLLPGRYRTRMHAFLRKCTRRSSAVVNAATCNARRQGCCPTDAVQQGDKRCNEPSSERNGECSG